MAEKETITKEKLKYSGLGDFKDAYAFAHDWIKNEGYGVTEDGYTEKVKGDSKDIEIKWTATKKITDYFKIEINIKWRILGMTDVEVEVDGKRKKMNKFAEVGIEIKGTLVKDYSGQWNISPLYKFFKDTYHKFIIPSRISEKEDEVRDLVKDYSEELKSYFELTGKR